MSKHRSRRRKSSGSPFSVNRKRTPIQTIMETGMGFGAAILVVGFAIWWFYYRPKPNPIDASNLTASVVKDNVVADRASFESIRDTGTLDQLNQVLNQLQTLPLNAEVPVKLETLNRKLEIAEAILNRQDLDEDLRVSTAKTALLTMGQIYGLTLKEGLDLDSREFTRYLNMCNTFGNDSSTEVAKQAQVAKAKTLIFEMVDGSSSVSMPMVKEAVDDLIVRYPNDSFIAANIKLLAGHLQARDRENGLALIRDIVSRYDSQSIDSEGVLNVIRGLKENVMINETGISALAQSAIRTGNYQEYLEELGRLIDLPDTGVDFVNSIYNAVASMESIGRLDIAKQILERLQSTAWDRTNPAAQVHALRICKFGFIRNEAVGQPFDFNDVDHRGFPIDVSLLLNRPCLIMYYSPIAADLPQFVQTILEVYELMAANTNVAVVCVAVEKPDGPLVGLHPDWISTISDPENPSQIFMRFPVTQVPYFAVVDKQGIMTAINVPYTNIKNVIEAIASK